MALLTSFAITVKVLNAENQLEQLENRRIWRRQLNEAIPVK